MFRKCTRCKTNFITSKSTLFAAREGIETDICLYCLIEVSGKELGRHGLVEKGTTPKSPPPPTSISSSEVKPRLQTYGCRPCMQRRNFQK